jgi:hypothetical protein
MKVFTKCVFDMNTMAVVEEEFYEYDGPVAMCGGGGSGVDKEYNRRMAGIAEKAQKMSEDQLYYWEHGVMPSAPKNAKGEFYDRETNSLKGVTPDHGYWTSAGGTYLDQKTADTLGPNTLTKYGFQWVPSSSFASGQTPQAGDNLKTASALGTKPKVKTFDPATGQWIDTPQNPAALGGAYQ